jgi:sodium pump decarboxylase gamma subunit
LGINWGQAGSVILSGLVIVFLILIILIAAVELTSRLVKSAEKKTQAAAPAPVKAAPVAAPAPLVQAGIEEETVAAISAAVYTCLEGASGAGAPAYAIKSIARASGVRPVWGFAGMRENTRPF